MEKCKINRKKINPTPKSITHRNPTKISPSWVRRVSPKQNR
jgi:hypothetical protein